MIDENLYEYEDIVICIDSDCGNVYHKDCNGIFFDFELVSNKKYTICGIFYCDGFDVPFLQFKECDHIYNSNRFIGISEYRKMKLKKIELC